MLCFIACVIVVTLFVSFLHCMRICVFFFLMIRRPPRSTLDRSSAASDVYKRQLENDVRRLLIEENLN